MRLPQFAATIAFMAANPSARSTETRAEDFGGAVAPVMLAKGSSAVYAYVGVPMTGVGYRRGLGELEIEGRLSLNYFRLSGSAELVARCLPQRAGALELAPFIGLGLALDSGATNLEANNFRFVGLRPRIGVVSTLRLSDTIRGLLTLEVPTTVPLWPVGGGELEPLIEIGSEFSLGGDLFGLVFGQVGIDAFKQPAGVTQYPVGFGLRLGLGGRLPSGTDS